MTTERAVWQESSISGEGLSVTTYSQAADGEPVVEDETSWTWSELVAECPVNAIQNRLLESATNG
jgi:hypothetical protein